MDDKIVKLYIQDQNGERVGFKAKTSAPFQKIANEYCKRKDVQVTSYNFLIDSDRVNLLRTIEELGLDSENEEENIVSAVVLQHGGGGVDGDDDENSKAITLRVRYDGITIAISITISITITFTINNIITITITVLLLFLIFLY